MGQGPRDRRRGEHYIFRFPSGRSQRCVHGQRGLHSLHPAGNRGTLNGQPSGTGEPVAYFIDFSGSSPTVNQVPCTFSFDLNSGTVTLAGSFPNLPSSLDFTVEYAKRFDGAGGENLLFYSEKTSDHAGYVIAVELVAAS